MAEYDDSYDIYEDDDPSVVGCSEHDVPYDPDTWEPIHGCSMCGIGVNECPVDGCETTVTVFF